MKVPACEMNKSFLVLNSNDIGTVEMSDVHLILPPPAISVVALTMQLKHNLCCRSERVFLFTCV